MWTRKESNANIKMSIQTLHRYLIKRFFPFGQIFRSDYDFSWLGRKKKHVAIIYFPGVGSMYDKNNLHAKIDPVKPFLRRQHIFSYISPINISSAVLHSRWPFCWTQCVKLLLLFLWYYGFTAHSFHLELLLLTRSTRFIWHELHTYVRYEAYMVYGIYQIPYSLSCVCILYAHTVYNLRKLFNVYVWIISSLPVFSYYVYADFFPLFWCTQDINGTSE